MTKRRMQIAAAVGVVILAVVVLAGWHFAGRVSTDDAQIDGHVNAISTRVGGTVTAVLVTDNQLVAAGTPLVRIDARDYEIAVQRAEADLAENEASSRAARTNVPMTSTVSTSQQTAAGSEMEGGKAGPASARARRREADAKATKAGLDLERLAPLVAKDEISKQEHDAAVAEKDATLATRESVQAEVREMEKEVETARARLAQAQTGPEQVTIQRARADSADAKAAIARANLAQARLNLSHTELRAPVAGVVSRRTVEVGQVVQAGQPLLAVVPLEAVWVTANFKENQLRDIRPGQAAVVEVDAYGGREYRGKVDSIAAATGARF